ncbi:MAG: hypothetical protein IPL61_30495 [Myxococcales bacterium]|nr:hypothetical protein [Myxococcales bacterium]
MSSPIATAFTSIDPASLVAVTGGASSKAATDERLMDKLTSITSAIADVATRQQQPQGGDAMGQLMPIVAMKMMKR